MQGRSGGGHGAPYDGKIAGLYDLESTLGAGHFAVVKLARHVFTGEKVAVKVIDKSKLDEVSRAHLFQEVRCMKLVQHPNVVRLYEVIDTQTKLYLILELGDGGDLYDYIMKHESGLSESLAKDYFRQIVRAISYCHRLHVVHRDLKPENVVFFERLGIVKLTDFGFSNKFCPGQKLETSCGSLAYSAPEILLGDSYDAPAVDVWSLGVILFMLVCGQAPFQEANDSETLIMIMDCKYTIPHYVSAGCKRLIGRMLVREPERRATLVEIAADTWLTDGITDSESAEFLDAPLVTREQLTGDDHALIVQKMANGKIASKDEIVEALEKNAYNHITATYYLLAERKLRSQRSERCANGDGGSAGRGRGGGPPAGAALLRPPRAAGGAGGATSARAGPRPRKCSIVREDEEEEEEGGEEAAAAPGAERRPSRSEGRLDLALQARLARMPPPPTRTANAEDENARARLGEIGIGRVACWMPFKRAPRPATAPTTVRPPPPPPPPPRPIISVTDADGRPARLSRLNEDGDGGGTSSSASDEEAERRERRAAPGGGAAREPARPRRDSRDDSGDAGGRGAGGVGGASGGGSGARAAPGGRSAAAAPRRRRRAPRKETRLRESRSLNRIAEASAEAAAAAAAAAERPEEGRRRWLAALMGRARSLGPAAAAASAGGGGAGALLRLVAGRGAPLSPLSPLACRPHLGDAAAAERCGLC